MEFSLYFQKLCHVETRRLVLVMGIVVSIVLVIHIYLLPNGNVLLSLFPLIGKNSFPAGDSSPNSAMVGSLNDPTLTNLSMAREVVQNIRESDPQEETKHVNGTKRNDESPTNGLALEEDIGLDNAFELGKDRKSENDFSSDNVRKEDTSLTLEKIPSVGKQATDTPSKHERPELLKRDPATSNDNKSSIPVKKGNWRELPRTSVMSISEMSLQLLQNHASSRSMRPQWSSVRDQEILSAKSLIENAPNTKNDQELHAPLFRNVSTFKRSYELMEQILKVYVYREGDKPIFHQPMEKGIYASEGWFMKLIEANKRFTVQDPRKAHLFYLPFSSQILKYTLYIPNSHNRQHIIEYLKSYLDIISGKYPFWNRTGGADHFFVACHDWAPSGTKHYMSHCIRAMCNADVNVGFTIGKDVSLPETYVRVQKESLRDLGGKPPRHRKILAFFAGNIHGYLRPILLHYWEKKDPDMKIYGPMVGKVKNKMSYIQHMKNSKYCICAKGFEVNSPRVVEAILYECVPVIISDNYVPPFFEILDWETFAIFVEEKDIPNLKDILLSIPEKKYLTMQMRVKKVQQHFLWHTKPVKYDIFHMILHSIWYNRVFQIKAQ